MKKTLTLITLALGLTGSLSAGASELTRVTCNGAGQDLILTIADGRLFSAAIDDSTWSVFGRDLLVTELAGDASDSYVRYLVNTKTKILEVDKSVLELKDGEARFGMDNYNCRF